MIQAEKRKTGDVRYSKRNILLEFVFRIIRVASSLSALSREQVALGKAQAVVTMKNTLKAAVF